MKFDVHLLIKRTKNTFLLSKMKKRNDKFINRETTKEEKEKKSILMCQDG